jgi:Domain of unknown function (DUF4436)
MRMRLGIFGLVLFIAAYVSSVVLYAQSGMGHSREITGIGAKASDWTDVTVDVEEIQSKSSLLQANLNITPAPQLLDPVTHALKEDLTLVAASVLTTGKRTWRKGTMVDVIRISGALDGDVADWPFDRYHTGPIDIEVSSGADQIPQPVAITLVDRLLGWKIEVNHVGVGEHSPYRLDLYRSPSTVAFGVLILGVFISLAGLAFFVAFQTVRGLRRFQPPMTTWYAAMLFAIMPLRTALPDAPPSGCWIDVTIVLWVIVVLVISMVLYIYCWWRHLKPEPDKPT